MEDNPNDPCCQQPACTPGPSGTLSSVPVPSYGQGFTGYGPATSGGGTSGTGPQTVNPGFPQPTGISGQGRMCCMLLYSYPLKLNGISHS